MTKIKRIAALAAASLLGIQMLGVGTALAAGGTSECDFNSDSLEITLGDNSESYVYLYIDGTKLWCDDTSAGGSVDEGQALSTIKSISVEMDDEEDSTDMLEIDLDDADTSGDAADWPRFSSFDIDVYTEIYVYAGGVSASGQGTRVTVGKSTLAFQGTTATLGDDVPLVEIDGSSGRDTYDASAAQIPVDIDAEGGNDTVKGGAKRDYLDVSDGGTDFVFGGGGNDDIDCDSSGYDFAYGQDGDDYLYGCWFSAPGAGDDELGDTNVARLSYADVTGDIAIVLVSGGGYDCGDDADISGASGVDIMPSGMDLDRLYLGSGNDYVYNDGCINDRLYMGAGNDVARDLDGIGGGDRGDGVYGDAGNDKLWGSDAEYDVLHGGAGDDRLYGKSYPDVLIGGAGSDQLWGGSGQSDMCKSGEVYNSCENFTFYLV